MLSLASAKMAMDWLAVVRRIRNCVGPASIHRAEPKAATRSSQNAMAQGRPITSRSRHSDQAANSAIAAHSASAVGPPTMPSQSSRSTSCELIGGIG